MKIGDLVEIERRKYDVVSNDTGRYPGASDHQTVAEIDAEHGSHPLTPDEFEECFGRRAVTRADERSPVRQGTKAVIGS